jgi:hypothetical protein
MWKIFILLYTLMPGEHAGSELTHTITVQGPDLYASQLQCEQAAENIGFRVHPGYGEVGVDFKCLQVSGFGEDV